MTLLLGILGAVSFAQTNSSGDTPAEAPRKAVVALSSIYMRLEPDYESPLETQELMGTVVDVVGEKGYWREIVSPQPYKAWCTEKGIVEMSEAEIEDYLKADKYIYANLYGHVFENPSLGSVTVCDLVGGDILRAGKVSRRWVEVILPSGQKGFVPKDEMKPFHGFRSIGVNEGKGGCVSQQEVEGMISSAMQLLGVPYLWGGMTPKGVDCSGLVRWAYLMNGILLPRNASQQVFCGDEVDVDADPAFMDEALRTGEGFENEMRHRIRNLRRGDLVFFGTPATEQNGRRITHVGIYLGEGRMIHSSHLVRINSLIPSEPDYYENSHRLIAASRLAALANLE
ncbi:MAG: C40 family peptidase [Candidatus Cryptobacteroides sp.]